MASDGAVCPCMQCARTWKMGALRYCKSRTFLQEVWFCRCRQCGRENHLPDPRVDGLSSAWRKLRRRMATCASHAPPQKGNVGPDKGRSRIAYSFVSCPLLALGGHRLLRCTCPRLTQSGHSAQHRPPQCARLPREAMIKDRWQI